VNEDLFAWYAVWQGRRVRGRYTGTIPLRRQETRQGAFLPGAFPCNSQGPSGRDLSLVQRDQKLRVAVRASYLGKEDHGSWPVVYTLLLAVWTFDEVSIEIKMDKIGFHEADDIQTPVRCRYA
jgi:hypothetical protein